MGDQTPRSVRELVAQAFVPVSRRSRERNIKTQGCALTQARMPGPPKNSRMGMPPARGDMVRCPAGQTRLAGWVGPLTMPAPAGISIRILARATRTKVQRIMPSYTTADIRNVLIAGHGG